MKWLERFWSKVEKTDGCWIWRGGRSSNGYGVFAVARRSAYAHRLSHEQVHGAIQAGMVIDHLCRNRAYVNPAHLEVVSDRENVARGMSRSAINARKIVCANG